MTALILHLFSGPVVLAAALAFSTANATTAHACEPWNCSNISPYPGPANVMWNYGYWYGPGWYGNCWWNGGYWYGSWC